MDDEDKKEDDYKALEINLGSEKIDDESITNLDLGCLEESQSSMSKDKESIGNVLDDLYQMGEDQISEKMAHKEILVEEYDQIDKQNYKSNGLTVVEEAESEDNDGSYRPMNNLLNEQNYFSGGTGMTKPLISPSSQGQSL